MGEIIGESLSDVAGGDAGQIDPRNFKWADNKTIAVSSFEDDVLLSCMFQTE